MTIYVRKTENGDADVFDGHSWKRTDAGLPVGLMWLGAVHGGLNHYIVETAHRGLNAFDEEIRIVGTSEKFDSALKMLLAEVTEMERPRFVVL